MPWERWIASRNTAESGEPSAGGFTVTAELPAAEVAR